MFLCSSASWQTPISSSAPRTPRTPRFASGVSRPTSTPGSDELWHSLGTLPEPTWTAVGRRGLAVRARTATAPTALPDLIFDLENVAKYRQLLEIENPDPTSRVNGRVHLRLLRWSEARGEFIDAQGSHGHAVFTEGDRAEFEIHSDHDETVWVNLVQFGADGAVQLLLPRTGHPTYSRGGVRLKPGQTLRVAADYYRQDPRYGHEVADGLTLQIPAGFPRAAEPGEDLDTGLLYLKLMVTLQSTDFEIFEVDSSRSGALWNPLQNLVELSRSARGSRSVTPPVAPDVDWTTLTRAVELRQRW